MLFVLAANLSLRAKTTVNRGSFWIFSDGFEEMNGGLSGSRYGKHLKRFQIQTDVFNEQFLRYAPMCMYVYDGLRTVPCRGPYGV